MPDFDEARWQDVEKKASDELDGIECQDLTAVPIRRVPPAKSDVIILHFKQAAVGDGHTVGVASEIAQNMLRSAEGRLGVDHQFFLPELLRLNPDLSPKLEEVINKALEKDRKLRYQNAADVRTDLQRLKRDSDSGRAGISLAAVAPAPVGRKKSRWVYASAAILAIALATSALFLHSRKAHALTDKDTVVLGDFTNTTGDPVFDGALRQGFSVQLEQSPFLSIIADQQIQQTLQMMGQKEDAKLTPEIAREICQRTGSAAVLNGSITQVGTPYLLTVKAVNCVNGESLASTAAQASDKSHVLDALGRAASEIRSKLGESLSTLQKFDTPLEQASTPSLEALKAASSGNRVLYATGETAAIPFFKRAIELDPNFALAYGWLARMYADIGEAGMAAEYSRKAYELRNRTSEAEKFFISAHFSIAVTGNMENAAQTCELWAQAYPRAWEPHDFLSGIILPVFGQYDKAVEEATKAIHLAPDKPVSYRLLMVNDIALNRLHEAKNTYGQVLERNLNHPFFHIDLYGIGFLQNDPSAMAQQVALSEAKPAIEDELLSLEADSAAYSGRLRQAREFSDRAMDSAERAEETETAATYFALSGLREALFGNADEARRRATLAVVRSAGRDVQHSAALAMALAYTGNDRQAKKLTDDLAKRYPEDTIVQYNYLPTIRAKLAVSKGNASEAIENLRVGAPYELGQTTCSVYGWNALYPVFVRGEAYLAAHQGGEAAAEFQKILDHRGILLNEPIGALAHLQIGSAYAMQGDTAKARAAYQDILALWKDADADIPVLVAAKSEYAKLK
jgi:tetratricopeptide (TPR) repeat protein